MALQDLTGNSRNKKFEGGVGGGASPVIYGGPEPVDYGEDVSAETLKAAVMGIYEKYGRNSKAMRMAKASPEFAALQGAGISVFGTPTARIGPDGKLTGGTTSVEGASEEMKKKAASQYAALEGGSRGRTARTPSTSLTDAISGGAKVTSPAPTENKPRVPESTAQTAQSTSMSALNPPATPTTDTPKVEPATKPNVMETTKGPRLFTTSRDYNDNKPQSEMQKLDESQGANNEAMSRNLAARDRNNRESLRGGASGVTAQDATDLGYGRGLQGQGNRMLDNSDASVKMMRAKERNDLQDEREAMKKEYNSQAQAAGATDDFNRKLAGYQTEKGDAQTAMQTGEVQDRSQFGGTKVYGRETYKGPGGKEFVGNQTSEGFIGLPSADQNKADTFNAKAGKTSMGGMNTGLNKYSGNIVGQSPMPQGKVTADDVRANYAFGGGSGLGGSLVSDGKRSQLEQDTAKYTTGTTEPKGSSEPEAVYNKKKTRSALAYAGPTSQLEN